MHVEEIVPHYRAVSLLSFFFSISTETFHLDSRPVVITSRVIILNLFEWQTFQLIYNPRKTTLSPKNVALQLQLSSAQPFVVQCSPTAELSYREFSPCREIQVTLIIKTKHRRSRCVRICKTINFTVPNVNISRKPNIGKQPMLI